MARTPREQNILTALPALLVLIVYLFSFNRGQELTLAQQALDSARRAQVSPVTVAAERRSFRPRPPSTKRSSKRSRSCWSGRAHARRTSAARAWRSGECHAARHQDSVGQRPDDDHRSAVEGNTGQTARGCAGCLRRLAAATPALSSTTSVDPRLAAQQTTPTTPTANANSAGNAQLWEVKFYGKYSNVLSALERLAKTTEAAVPVGLKMDKTHPDADGWRVWT